MLSNDALEWQAKARAYADEYLQPHEVEAILNGGVLSAEIAVVIAWVAGRRMQKNV